MKDIKQVVEEWWDSMYGENGDIEKFMDFAEGLNINDFVVENGEKIVWLEDGINYIAHGERIGEFDGKKEKEIIKTLEEVGVDFIERS